MRKIPCSDVLSRGESANYSQRQKSEVNAFAGLFPPTVLRGSLADGLFYIPNSSCSPLSSALSNAPAAGRFFVLYLYALANSPSLYARTVITF